MKPRANYGIDSPYIIAGELIVGGVLTALAVPHLLGLTARWIFLALGLVAISSAAGMISYSKSGKLRICDEILESIRWSGSESVLDIGCGRGLLLVGAARHLTTGKAVGVDMWLPKALTGNSPGRVLENAALEGVAGRVEVVAGDARKLPFHDKSFDIIVSNFVVHEMQTGLERKEMIREIARLLKPGGQVALVDFIFTGQCLEDFVEFGLFDATRTRLNRFWSAAITSFGMVKLYKVTGTKATSESRGGG